MKMLIHKYELIITDGVQDILMPESANVLSVGVQRDAICVWVMVDADTPLVTHKFRVVGTGWIMDPEYEYGEFVSTVLDGSFVWHVFYGGKK